jgi:hypothetical protein
LQTRTEGYSTAIDIADKIWRGESSRNAKSIEAIRLRSSVNGYAGIGLQPCSIQPRQISCNQPRYSAKRHHIFHITARFPGCHR